MAAWKLWRRRNFLTQSISENVPRDFEPRTHSVLMETTINSEHPPYRLVDKVVSAEEQQRGREIAAAQLQAIRNDPEEWASYEKEIDLLAFGYFQSAE